MGEKGRGWGLSFRCEESARGVVVCRGKKEGRILLPREERGREGEQKIGWGILLLEKREVGEGVTMQPPPHSNDALVRPHACFVGLCSDMLVFLGCPTFAVFLANYSRVSSSMCATFICIIAGYRGCTPPSLSRILNMPIQKCIFHRHSH